MLTAWSRRVERAWWLRLNRVLVLRTKWTDKETVAKVFQALAHMKLSERIGEARALSCSELRRRIGDGSYGFAVPKLCGRIGDGSYGFSVPKLCICIRDGSYGFAMPNLCERIGDCSYGFAVPKLCERIGDGSYGFSVPKLCTIGRTGQEAAVKIGGILALRR